MSNDLTQCPYCPATDCGMSEGCGECKVFAAAKGAAFLKARMEDAAKSIEVVLNREINFALTNLSHSSMSGSGTARNIKAAKTKLNKIVKELKK